MSRLHLSPLARIARCAPSLWHTLVSGATSLTVLAASVPLWWASAAQAQGVASPNGLTVSTPNGYAVVVRDDISAEVLSNGRYEQMQGLQQEADKPGTPVLPIANDQVLPPFPAKDTAKENAPAK